MRFTQPVNNDPTLIYNTIKIQGCANSTVGFNFLKEEPTVSKRRYCNKVLVHECVTVDVADSMDLTSVELLATDDPCYELFNIYKSSETVDNLLPTLELQYDSDLKVIGVIASFSTEETCGQPLRLAYKLYGYTEDEEKILLAVGNLAISPCVCPDGITPQVWTDVGW